MSVCRTQQDLNSDALMRARVHPEATGLDGTGIVICMIDYGFDLLHPAFRTATGETRFAYLLDQNGPCLDRAEINRLLRQTDKSALADGNDRHVADSVYDPHANSYGRGGVQVGAHGSWVASIAAGSRCAEFTGVAPNATLIGVQLDLPDHAWREEDEDGQPTWLARTRGNFEALQNWRETLREWQGWLSYEDNAQLADAIHEAYALACGLNPAGVVINLSLGAWAGGHDAGSHVNRAISSIARANDDPARPMTYVVAATGNAGCDRGHVGGRISGDTSLAFTWSIRADATSQSKLEIWSDAPGGIDVTLASITAAGASTVRFEAAENGLQPIYVGGELVGVGENLGEVRDGLNAVRILLHPAATEPDAASDEAFDFGVTVHARDNVGGTVHAWIERDSSGAPQSRLSASDDGLDGSGPRDGGDGASAHSTLTPLACAPGVISVAGLDSSRDADVALPMSGTGPRPWPIDDRLPSPVLAAPASGLFGARSKTEGYMRGSGTSGAAAIVSGAIALAMQAAEQQAERTPPSLERGALLGALLRSRPLHVSPQNWQPDLGFGALCFSAPTRADAHPRSDLLKVPRQEELPHERTLSPADGRAERLAPAETR